MDELPRMTGDVVYIVTWLSSWCLQYYDLRCGSKDIVSILVEMSCINNDDVVVEMWWLSCCM